LPSLTVASRDAWVHEAVLRFAGDIEGELNVKAVAVVEDDSQLVSLTAKANFKVLGRRLGKNMKVVAQAVEGLDAATLRGLVDGGTVVVEGETLGTDDLVFRRDALPGRVADSDGGITVVLDTTVDAALEQEGFARELINRVQNLRKTAELDVSDRIELAVACAPASKLAGALAREDLQQLIKGETLAKQLVVVARDSDEELEPALVHDHREQGEIDGEQLVLRLRRC
jgi:isoleucyl-tRNA synthetase